MKYLIKYFQPVVPPRASQTRGPQFNPRYSLVFRKVSDLRVGWTHHQAGLEGAPNTHGEDVVILRTGKHCVSSWLLFECGPGLSGEQFGHFAAAQPLCVSISSAAEWTGTAM